MSGLAVRTLDRLDEVRGLEGWLRDYLHFVTSDLQRATGIAVDPERLIGLTLAGLDKVIPPKGQTFVAEDVDGTRIGMGFLRQSGPDAMEIKRLYVPPSGRGRGAGRALVDTMLDAARAAGAKAIRIDTTRNLETAIALYRRIGFVERPPYPESDHYDDDTFGDTMVFMEKRL